MKYSWVFFVVLLFCLPFFFNSFFRKQKTSSNDAYSDFQEQDGLTDHTPHPSSQTTVGRHAASTLLCFRETGNARHEDQGESECACLPQAVSGAERLPF